MRATRPLILTLLALAAGAAAAQAGYDRGPAAVMSAAAGRPLAMARGQTMAQAVGAALGARGRDPATLAATAQVNARTTRAGITHTRLEQTVDGLSVYGAYAKAAFNANGELIHLIDHLAPVSTTALPAARVDALQALRSVVGQLHPAARVTLRHQSTSGNTVTFDGGRYFWSAPTAEAVAVPLDNGSMTRGWLVQTWSRRDNQLHHTLVGGDGQVLHVEARTNTDSYNVFAKDPVRTPQGVFVGPAGWLGTGTQTTWNISGNNTNTYLDADANNAADGGGTTVTDGNFLTAATLGSQPSTTGNRAVAVQNLFYLTNRMHDLLYQLGFDEPAGNFQKTNFVSGGLGNDPVLAEAQDGSGTDNANFATPNDGQSPRMQMYLWTGAGATHEVVIGPTSYGAMGAGFGPALTTSGVSGAVAAASPADGCSRIGSAVSGKVALINRGTCDFATKVLNAQSAGATSVIIANNSGTTEIFTMGGTNSRIRIPSVMVSQNDGAALRGPLGASATLRKKAQQPLQIDGDLDSDIVFHEYGHGLTWRMIGGMSGPLAGAIGEGASDVNAFLVNDSPIMGAYAYSNPNGIRRNSYEGYPRTYKDVTGAEVHDDGEIYAGAMWKVRTNYLAAGITTSDLHHDFVQGMNFTPSKPTFENMRDGMLQAVAGTGRECLIWRGFAASGIGVGAKGTVSRRGAVTITESKALPTGC